MAMYSNELIEEILSSNDIVDVVSRYMSLKKKGKSYFGNCPFHNEKTPSFSVSQDKQIFKCFGCGQAGNLIHFVMKIENISFPDTLKLLAEKSGIDITKYVLYKNDKQEILRQRMKAVIEDATKYFQACLYSKNGKKAQDYVNSRKMNLETLKNFRIGYAIPGLYAYLKKKGYEDKEILETGLVYKRDDGRYIDRYIDRLMFPISDITGTVIAFGGRRLDDNKKYAKYINSNENLVYSKSKHLYGMNIAKKYSRDRIIVVEGYMDAVSLHQRGIKNVVASLGTALTKNQALLLANTSSQVVIGYDSDGAGTQATLRGLDILKETGVDLRVLELGEFKDPDEFVLKKGKQAFLDRLDDAISLVEFKVKILTKKYNISNSNEKIMFFNEVLKILSSVENEVEKEIYIKNISQKYNISEQAIRGDIKKRINKTNKMLETEEKKQDEKIEKSKMREIKKSGQQKREELLIYILLQNMSNKQAKEKIRNRLEELDAIENFEKINKKIIQDIYKDEYQSAENFMSIIEDKEELERVVNIYSKDYKIEYKQSLDELLETFKKEYLKQKRDDLVKQLSKGDLSEQEQREIETKLNEVIKKLM